MGMVKFLMSQRSCLQVSVPQNAQTACRYDEIGHVTEHEVLDAGTSQLPDI